MIAAFTSGDAVVSHAARELVADSDAAAANEIRVVERDRALLQPGNCHRNFPGRTRRIPTLNGAID